MCPSSKIIPLAIKPHISLSVIVTLTVIISSWNLNCFMGVMLSKIGLFVGQSLECAQGPAGTQRAQKQVLESLPSGSHWTWFLWLGCCYPSSLPMWLGFESSWKHYSWCIHKVVSRKVWLRTEHEWHHPMGWGSRLSRKEKESWDPAFISLCFLTTNTMWPAALLLMSCFSHHDRLYSWTMRKRPANKQKPSLSCFHQVFCHSHRRPNTST